MKTKSITFLVLFFALATAVRAQVGSSECIEEIKKVYAQIDHETMLKSDKFSLIRYRHQYTMKTDPTAKVVDGQEWRLYKRDFMQHDSPEFMEVTDATEAFNHRKYQFMIYRTKGTLKKANVIAGMNTGIFEHCQVKKCDYIPAPGHDSLSYKRAVVSVIGEHKDYPVEEFEMVWNPLDLRLISIEMKYTDKSLVKWAHLYFNEINNDHNPGEHAPADAKSVFLGSNGELKEEMSGIKMMDYR